MSEDIADDHAEMTVDDFAAVNAGSHSGDEWAARVDLAAMYRLAAHFGYDDTLWNHITMRVPGSDHDSLTVGRTAGEAFMVMHYLVRGCRTLLAARATGLEIDPGPTEIWELAKNQYDHFPLGDNERPALLRLLDRVDPWYRQ